MDKIHKELLQQAVAARKEGDTDAALDLIKEVLDEDEENVVAWRLLAQITPNLQEKRVAVANVLKLKPDDEVAQKLQARLDAELEAQSRDEIIPGVPRRLAYGVAAGFGGLFIALLIFFIFLNNRSAQQEATIRSQRQTEQARPTMLAMQQTQDMATETQQAFNLTATQVAINPPTRTPGPTSAAPTLPPTATNTPAPTSTPTPIPPPPGLPGVITGRQGRGSPDADLPLVLYPPSRDAPVTPVADVDGRYVRAFPGSEQFVFTVYNRNAYLDELRIVDKDGTRVTSTLNTVSSNTNYDSAIMPSLSADGSAMVFVAEPFDQPEGNALYIANLNAQGEDAIQRVTTDDSTYSYPALSPDGNTIAVVREVTTGDNPGTDLIAIDANSFIPRSLTTDRNVTRENMPRWSPNGSLIFYAAVSSAQGTSDGTPTAEGTAKATSQPDTDDDESADHDIYMMDPRNPDSGRVRISTEANDIFPVPAPDGRHLVFASNRRDDYELFIFDLETSETYQLTSDSVDNYAGDWRE